MRKTVGLLISGFLLIFLIGCSGNDYKLEWHATKEEAISHGAAEEGIENSSILSIEEIDEETIVFYTFEGAFGVASIAESDEGYAWYRSTNHVGFSGEGSYATMGYSFETEAGNDISVLVGKAFDANISKMRLSGDGAEKELQVFQGSRLFFTTHDAPFHSLELIPMEDNKS